MATVLVLVRGRVRRREAARPPAGRRVRTGERERGDREPLDLGRAFKIGTQIEGGLELIFLNQVPRSRIGV